MLKKLLQNYGNVSLYAKISIILWALAIMITLIILLASGLYYSYIYEENTLQNAKLATENAVNTLNINYSNIINRFVSICGTEDFAADLKQLTNPELSYAAKEGLMQDELTDLFNCNYMVNSALILDADGETYYSLYKNPLRSALLPVVTPEELSSIDKITWLPERNSPFRSTINVIPVVFPISLKHSVFVGISDKITWPAEGYVIVMLDSASIAKSLAVSSESSSGNFLIMTRDGVLLNSTADPAIQDAVQKDSTKEFIQGFAKGSKESALYITSDYYLAASEINNTELVLVNYVAKERFLDVFGSTGLMIFMVILMVIMILVALSFLMARYVSSPLNKLVQVVNQIGKNEYQEHIDFATSDEIGKLCRAINSMHDTILNQMEQIKQEEVEKYMAEVKLLAEQINPHFLYNTLECIQLEVMGGHPETASNMIQYLADYLRIGLSYGDDVITISNELRHVHAYIKIMNQRFHQSITFMYKADPGLDNHYVLKTILQPLVENSIKHGFSIDGTGIPISSPTIEINFSERETGFLHIEIIDNGAGFDVAKTEEILYHDSSESNGRHVGLHNIYYRLAAYYGREQISFELSSIPYYSNSICITIPMVTALPRKEKTL